jgi:uncharacterized protein (TIGR03066 family)
MRLILGCALVLLCLGTGRAGEDKKDEKIDAKKLVGKWSPKEQKKGESVVVEFGKDGKLTMTYTGDGKESKREGMYKLDGDKLSVTFKKDDKDVAHTLTVTKLTDTELVTKDDGKDAAFVRVKDK